MQMEQMEKQSLGLGQEPPMYLQRPSASQSQDVRHLLAKIFRDLYTRDVVRSDFVKNLKVSKGGDDPYHEQYVENLEQVHTEWQRRMDEAAMLERHIMQAQAKSMSADERALNKASASCVEYSSLGLPPVRTHFPSCIDTQLLSQHNLLTPSDYMLPDPLPVSAPQGPQLPDYARDTLASQQHSRPNTQHQLEPPSAWSPGDSFEIETLVSDIGRDEYNLEKQETVDKQPEFPQKYGWKEFLSEEQREADRKVLDLLQAKVNYLRNPRFVAPDATDGGRTLIQPKKRKTKDSELQIKPKQKQASPVVFVPFPSVVEFNNYKVGEVYEITLELKNMSAVMRQCRVLPPSSNIFSIGLGQFPGENGLVAPGMSCRYDIRFAPNSLKDYEDLITVQTQASEPIIIPLRAYRPPPVLTLPKSVDLGYCLVGGIQITHVLVKNVGGPGRFCLMPRNKWPTTSIRTVLPTNSARPSIKCSPFEIIPATFELGHGKTTVLEVVFSPQVSKSYVQEMTIACDNCHTSHFKLQGEGQIAKVGLAGVEMGLSEPLVGEFNDISAKHLVRFDDLNPYTYTEMNVSVKNFTRVELPYHWMIYKPINKANQNCDEKMNELASSAPAEDRVPELNGVFSVFPHAGVLKPSETTNFKFTFAPPKEGNYHSAVHMLLQQVPSIKESQSLLADLGVVHEEEELQSNFGQTLSYRDVTGLQMEVKGKCLPLNVVLHPYGIFIQSSCLIGSSVKRLFTMANHSYSTIAFQWETYTKSYMIEVEPPLGELDPGMAMDLEISITGVEPGPIDHTLLCHVVHMEKPLHLRIQAEFKGPEIKILQPTVNFGLVRVGQSESREITILNSSAMKIKFSISESRDNEIENNDKMIPSGVKFVEVSGEIPPLERKTVQLIFSPSKAQNLKSVCKVQCDQGETCFVALYGEAQNPIVCFLECDQVLSEVFLDVPKVFNVVLHNQTLLPTVFKWGQVEGFQKNLCEVEVEKKEGKILSWEQKSIAIRFTPFSAIQFNEVQVPCFIEGQEEPLYINIRCEVKTLQVTYKTSTDRSQVRDDMSLNFGDNVRLGECVTRYIHVYNQTAIRASFEVEADYFVATLPAPPDMNENYTAQSNRRNLLTRTPNIADPLSKAPQKLKADFNKLVLREGKGAAFVIQPVTGHLQPFGEQIIEVTAYNDMWGTYKDKLLIKVGDLEPGVIDMIMTVIGCPLSFQMTIGQPDQKPIARFGCHMSGGAPTTRKLKINNSSPLDIRIDWQGFGVSDDSEKLIDFITCFGRSFPRVEQNESSEVSAEEGAVFHLETADVDELGKIVSCYLRPHEGDPMLQPFSFHPKQMVVPGYGFSYVNLTFTPSHASEVFQEMNIEGFGIGYLSLDNEDKDKSRISRLEGYEIDALKLHFTASVKPPLLTIEETDEEGLVFRSAMSDIMHNGKVSQQAHKLSSLKLTNDTFTPLTFKLKVKDPFLLVDLDPSISVEARSSAFETSPCTLNPREHIMVNVAFIVSKALINVIARARADNCLEFQKQLNIQFENGTKQKVPLLGILAVPQFEISTEVVDFGVCLVGQRRQMEFVITNYTSSDCYWSIEIDRSHDCYDCDVFEFQPRFGVLKANVNHVSNSKTVINVFFNARHSDAYDCRYVVTGHLGEMMRYIHVVGVGSYDGKHEAILNI
ncbi:unnamed protein product [Lymnaea stagnalis]|uniref:Deleted in lung and esophageal cancer protein 1 Ig-like domain-containing protein n=1 Tax=Lymnaea stagnalis TaxID=6523 RepID=A0AAV2HID7_LYMST